MLFRSFLVNKGEDPRHKDCQIIRCDAVHDIFDWGYVFILYSNFTIAQWCPFYIVMQTETVRFITPAPAPAPMIICSAMEDSDAIEMKNPSQKEEELVGTDSMAVENLKEEDLDGHAFISEEYPFVPPTQYLSEAAIMADSSINVVDNLDIVEGNQSQVRRRCRRGSKSSFGSASMGTIIIIVACLAIISPASAAYHGKFLTRPDYLRD